MLGEMHIKNFAVIKDLCVNFNQGLNIISGDEGTGKSLLVDALSLLMGARAPGGLIRSGSKTARTEVIFWPSEETLAKIVPVLEENGIELEANGMLLISRDFQDGGRSVARINNSAVPLSLLKQIGRYLVDIHGQMEYLSLLDSGNQLNLIDAYGNLLHSRQQMRRTVEELRQKEREIAEIPGIYKEGYQELLQYQVEEIDNAGLEDLDEHGLVNERDVLRRAEAICRSCLDTYAGLYGDENSASVMIHKTLMSLRMLSGTDKNMEQYNERLANILVNIEEIAREVRAYSDKIESSEGRLEEIERHIEAVSSLKRKYGNSVEAILSFRDKSRKELESMQSAQERKERLESDSKELKSKAARIAEELSLARRHAAANLVKLVNDELADLGLEWAKFDIALARREDAGGLELTGGKSFAFTADGIDRPEFQVATNPGEPMRAMAAIASGGETSRIVLAIKSALKMADPIPTLVFDEIDLGIGGRNADSVGRKLAALAHYHQVLGITHLPQIACFGDVHLKMVKEIESGRAATKVEQIEGSNRLKELAVMLGSECNGNAMLKGAEALLKNAEKWKGGVREMVALK